MKDIIQIAITIIGILLLFVGIAVGAYLLFPVLCAIVVGIELIIVSKAMEDMQ